MLPINISYELMMRYKFQDLGNDKVLQIQLEKKSNALKGYNYLEFTIEKNEHGTITLII